MVGQGRKDKDGYDRVGQERQNFSRGTSVAGVDQTVRFI